MSTEAEQLDAKLTRIALTIEDAVAYEHEHGLARHDTRKLPADALGIIPRWHAFHDGSARLARILARAARWNAKRPVNTGRRCTPGQGPEPVLCFSCPRSPDKLAENWERAQQLEPLVPVEPLP